MKIIEQCDITAWSHRFTCNKCKSVCEADHKDVKYNYSAADGPYGPTECYSLNCPVCNDSFSLHKVEVPELIKIKAREKYNNQRTSSYWER